MPNIFLVAPDETNVAARGDKRGRIVIRWGFVTVLLLTVISFELLAILAVLIYWR